MRLIHAAAHNVKEMREAAGSGEATVFCRVAVAVIILVARDQPNL